MRTLSVSTKALLLIGLTLLAYLPALHNGFIWDDDAWLMKNQTLFGWSGLHELWFNPLALQQYYPITGTVFWIEYQLWRLDPVGYHANVLLYGLNAVLFALALRKLRLPAPWFATTIFAVPSGDGRIGRLDHRDQEHPFHCVFSWEHSRLPAI